jgi:hypothetical protein
MSERRLFGLSREQYEAFCGYAEADRIIVALDGQIDEKHGIGVQTAQWAIWALEELVELAGQQTPRGEGARLRIDGERATWLEDVRALAREVIAGAEFEHAEALVAAGGEVDA